MPIRCQTKPSTKSVAARTFRHVDQVPRPLHALIRPPPLPLPALQARQHLPQPAEGAEAALRRLPHLAVVVHQPAHSTDAPKRQRAFVSLV